MCGGGFCRGDKNGQKDKPSVWFYKKAVYKEKEIKLASQVKVKVL